MRSGKEPSFLDASLALPPGGSEESQEHQPALSITPSAAQEVPTCPSPPQCPTEQSLPAELVSVRMIVDNFSVGPEALSLKAR